MNSISMLLTTALALAPTVGDAGKDCAVSYRDKGYVTDLEKRWTYFLDVVHEFTARPDGSAVVAFKKSARRYEIPSGSDPFAQAARKSFEGGSPVHVAVEEGADEGHRPKSQGGGKSGPLPKVHWVDAIQQHPSCR